MVQIDLLNFRASPYCGANETLKILGLALLRSTSNFRNFKLGLIPELINFQIFELGQFSTDFQYFRTWAYCG